MAAIERKSSRVQEREERSRTGKKKTKKGLRRSTGQRRKIKEIGPISKDTQGPIAQAQSELSPEIFKAHFEYAPATSKDGFD